MKHIYTVATFYTKRHTGIGIYFNYLILEFLDT